MIFGEVFYVGDLTDRQRELITCNVLTVLQTLSQLKAHLSAAINVGGVIIRIKRIIVSMCSIYWLSENIEYSEGVE